MRRGIGSAVVLLAGFGLFARFCSGPAPRVVSSRLRGQIAEATIRNQGFGEGDVSVKFTLRGAGPPLVRNVTAELGPRQEARVETVFSGARGSEQIEVEVDYPPR